MIEMNIAHVLLTLIPCTSLTFEEGAPGGSEEDM